MKTADSRIRGALPGRPGARLKQHLDSLLDERLRAGIFLRRDDAHVGVSRATVARWHRQPEFAAAVKRYRFGWSPRRRAALALMAPDRPGSPLYLREVAAAVGVSRRTLYRWRCAPDFAAAHDAAWAAYHARRAAQREAEADRQLARAASRAVYPRVCGETGRAPRRPWRSNQHGARPRRRRRSVIR